MSDKIDMIYDLLKADREETTDFRREVRASHKETGEKLSKLETETSERLTKIEATNEIQNQQLTVHIAGVQTLKKLHEDNAGKIENNKGRIVVLEEPSKIRKSLRDKLIMTGKVAGAILTICGLIAYFLGLF